MCDTLARHAARQTFPLRHSPIWPWPLGTLGWHTARKRSSKPAITWTEEQRESMRRTSYGDIAHLLAEYREKRARWEAEHAE